ncbi:hypothetical protein DES36_12133 [Alkalibaculum bacchi]|uniref:YcxB-like protein n=1 Tax=Alkalibaculum bacchi TaxID=645887 RepID=A0A366I0R6_9FIRM|nr:hypothetical protein DES36_12133 [Alkalibaculum bacchi]
MVINYRNTKEDSIEVNKYLVKNKLYRFSKIFYIYYLRYFVFLIICILLLYNYVISENFAITSKEVWFYLFCSLVGYLITDNSLGTALSNSLDKIIKQKPYILDNKFVTIKENQIEVFNNTTEEKGIFDLKNICKIVENEYNLYIFFTGYKDFLVIPYSAFENEVEKNIFIVKLG